MKKNILNNIRVLDFGRYIAGPWCAALLADFGADVIRVDKIGGGEDRDVIPLNYRGLGAIYQQVNRNKRSICLANRGNERDAVLADLIKTSDIVVANLPEKALRALGIDYKSLAAIKPDIILTSMSAFGTNGPFSDKIGFDVVGQAMSGAMYLTGDTKPMRSSVSWVDYSTAVLAAFGTVMAIIERQKSHKGQEVRASLLGSALMASNPYLIEESQTLIGRNRLANKSQVAAPADMFETKDGYIVMQAIGNPMFERWAKLIGDASLITDPRFSSDKKRSEYADMLSSKMQSWCQDKTSAEVLSKLEEVKLPCAEVLSPKAALCHQQILSGEFFFAQTSKDQSDTNKPYIPLSSTPVELSRTPGQLNSEAPDIGQHSRQILEELGYENNQITHLFQNNIIA